MAEEVIFELDSIGKMLISIGMVKNNPFFGRKSWLY